MATNPKSETYVTELTALFQKHSWDAQQQYQFLKRERNKLDNLLKAAKLTQDEYDRAYGIVSKLEDEVVLLIQK